MIETQLVTTLKRDATKIIAGVRKKRRPVLITNRGLPAAYLVDPESYDLLQTRLTILEGIARGEEDIRQGRVYSHEAVKKKLKKWLK